MPEEDNQPFGVVFKEEFDVCLDRIEEFFVEQGPEPLQWWYAKETEIIDHIERLLSLNLFAGPAVEWGQFKGLYFVFKNEEETCDKVDSKKRTEIISL
ncbi:hypothetical protein O9H85_27595 [Paenibacillus filicis]|uniref:Uncharacterized protein n=1 Tax=Paenibacillus gyeongsangnamensis TaxID=3388067 RepID=A0ABT4QGV3_9BACL|nr:hypothetical protein [Paenibacillus filicis]MCZ8516099.1 hypothetical protein [Paenibacillus filicis]